MIAYPGHFIWPFRVSNWAVFYTLPAVYCKAVVAAFCCRSGVWMQMAPCVSSFGPCPWRDGEGGRESERESHALIVSGLFGGLLF